ncbi:MAG: glycosyltransferase family 2 protein [Deltaproteobacteria bacterium]|nr:glycosyltransferase family 2 protein [Deltaproteobacteria bacterium]
MYRGCPIAVVMPAYNAAPFLPAAIAAVPDYVDHLVVVDDGSVDETPGLLARSERPGLVGVRHETNRGVGAAIATGYRRALELGARVVAVMAGDGQMDPADLPTLLDPVVSGEADYAKGNRFRHPAVRRAMPRARLVGNVALSLLTKVTSGYHRLFDSQCGYTAISRAALLAIEGRLFSRYGYPNDLLARLRAVDARVVDVPVRPVYEGQPSGIRLWTVLYPILFVLLGSMLRRLWRQRLRPLFGMPRVRLRAAPPLVPDADRTADHLLPAPPP